MRNVKKIVAIILVILMLIISTSNVFGYEVEVTKDNLQKAFNEYAKGYSGGYIDADGTPGIVSFGESEPIEVTDNQLIDSNDSENVYKVDYSLEGNPTFSTKITFNKDSDFEIVSDMKEILRKPVLGILGVSIVQGADIGFAHHYYGDVEGECDPLVKSTSYSIVSYNDTLSITIDGEQKEFKKGSFKPSEVVNFLFEDNKTIKDEDYGIYTYTVTVTETSSENYEIKSELKINKDSDFSKIINVSGNQNNSNNTNTNKSSITINTTNTGKNTSQNTNTNTNKNTNTNTKANTNTNKAISATKNTTKNTNTNTNKSTVSSVNTTTENIPYTGVEDTVMFVIAIVIGVALIFYIKFEKINKDMK